MKRISTFRMLFPNSLISYSIRQFVYMSILLAVGFGSALGGFCQMDSVRLSPHSYRAHFGKRVSGLPDVNGDGIGDIVVGAPSLAYHGGAWYDDAGVIDVFSGADLSRLWYTYSPTPSQIGEFGRAVMGVPDVNGDGGGDIIVGAWQESKPGYEKSGKAYVVSGADGSFIHTLLSGNPEDLSRFGYSVAGVQDVDGDGYHDFIVGAPYEDPGGSPDNAGRAYVYSGHSGSILYTLASPNEENGGEFGYAVGSLSDINGDGRGDLVVGAPSEDPGSSPSNAGRVYIFSGSDASLLMTLISPMEEISGKLGAAVASVPDIDGDGIEDIVVGSDEMGLSSPGRAHIFSGGSGNLIHTLASSLTDDGSYFGRALAGMPDMNGDSRGDIIVGAGFESPGTSPADAGRVHIFCGSTGNLIRILQRSPDAEYGQFGWSVARLPDITLDGKDDFIVGAPEMGQYVPNGEAFVFSSVEIAVDRTSIPFGPRRIDSGPTISQSIVVSSLGISELTFIGDGFSLIGSGAADFGFVGPVDSSPLAVGATREIFLYFDPELPGTKSASLRITTGDVTEKSVNINLSGKGTAPDIDIVGGPFQFGSQDIYSGITPPQSAILRNLGDEILNFTGDGIAILGDHPEDFSIISGVASAMNPSETKEVQLAFDPSADGLKSAVLRITTDDWDEPLIEIEMSGVGVTFTMTPTPSPTKTVTPTSTPTSTMTPTPTLTLTPTPTRTPLVAYNSTTIGADGGNLQAGPGGFYTEVGLMIPSGAINAATLFEVQEPSEEDRHGIRACAEFLPSGIHIPGSYVALEFRTEDVATGHNGEDMRIHVWEEFSGKWEEIPGSRVPELQSTDKWTISAPISHLSVYSAFVPSTEIEDWKRY